MNEPNATEFIPWLAANIDNVRNGAGSFQGNRVTGESTAVRYFTCFSFVVFTTRTTSPYLLQGSDAARKSAITSTLLTLLLGWWGIPFGIVFTPIYLVKNLLGGEKCTVNELIGMLEKPGEFQKKNEALRSAPLKVMGVVLAVVLGSIALLQGYIYFKGKSNPVPNQPRYASNAESAELAAAPGDPVAAFMTVVQRRLRREWHPPKGNVTTRCIVNFKITNDGRAHNVHITKSSNIEEMDQASLNAVRASEIFPPLPAVLKGTAEIEFTFDYNVLNQKHNKAPASAAKESED